jgi:hypothetical protein
MKVKEEIVLSYNGQNKVTEAHLTIPEWTLSQGELNTQVSRRQRIRFSPHPPQYLLMMMFLMVAIVTGVRWNLTVLLI